MNRVIEEMTVEALYDLTHTAAADYLRGFTYPWEALAGIRDMVLALGRTLSPEEYDHPQEDVWISKSAKIWPYATVTGPAVIGPGTEVRPGAFLRGSILVGEGCVVGNSTELKNVILFDGVQVPHYNYVGDSILGYKAHMGAGSITSNVRGDKALVTVKSSMGNVETGRKKVGAMLGDRAEIGCGAVMNPGTVIGRDSNIYPLTMVRGFVPAGCMMKNTGAVVRKEKE